VLRDTTSVTRSIATAIVVKEGDLFLLTEPGGFVPLSGPHGLGLYYRDCRYLNGYELQIGGVKPDPLISSTAHGYAAISQLVTPDLLMADGRLLSKDELGIKRQTLIPPHRTAVCDVLTFHNYGFGTVAFPVLLTFACDFEDVFNVRGIPPTQRGSLYPPALEDGELRFCYRGADSIERILRAQFSMAPRSVEETTAHFRVRIPARTTSRLLVTLEVEEHDGRPRVGGKRLSPAKVDSVQHFLKRASDEWLAGETQIRSSSLALNAIVDRSIRDLRVLRTRMGDDEFFAAGVPWFATLFGRDSLITAMQMLAFNPKIAEQTLRILATHQGQAENTWRDEEPGKILHELRVGELARTGEIPHTPYYGTVDATALFLNLVAFHANWTGDMSLFRELRPNVEAALRWIDVWGDRDGDGYVEYACRSEKGLANQGWRDSGDGVPNADGSLAVPPIALCEVQGYVYAAKRALAGLFRRAGEVERAAQLEIQAAKLREQFNRDFWLDDVGTYALALQGGKRPVTVVSSNAGHVLWSAIADPEKAARTAQRLMAPDMFTGWGVRTLASREMRFNPTGYHLGTVWPHDNSIIAAGFRRYGLDGPALQVFRGIVEAAMHFPDHRLPELFMGFARQDYGVPVSYPVACRPQAWAAGTVPYLVRTLLGLTAEGLDGRLRIVQPVLPDFVHYLEVHRLKVGQATVDLRFDRTPNGKAAVDVLRIDGPLDIVVDLGASANP
jgi:glycogen debranching enzyme